MMSYVPGLEGVIVGETGISNVEGEVGRLSYRGVSIETLVEWDYLDVVYLVLFGQAPQPDEKKAFRRYLANHGDLSAGDRDILRAMPATHHSMALLQGMIPLLSLSDETYAELGDEASRGLQVIAKYPALLAAIREQREADFVAGPFDFDEEYLSGFLSMFTRKSASARELAVFKTVQVMQLEHSFNAGTFATRVIGSTLAPVTSVLSGGVGALAGILHGGADEAALRAAYEVGRPEKAAAFVDDILANKGRLMGMGHREYRTVDPRSRILKPLAAELCNGTGHEVIFNVLLAIEVAFNSRMKEKGKDVWANLEFYKGVVYEALGISAEYFTATFAMARSVGWLSHFIESRQNNRIIRPAALYTGPSVSA